MLKKETRIDIILSEDNKKDIKANNLKKVIDDIISRKDDIDEIGYNQTLTYLYDLDNDFINREIFLNKFQDSIKNSDYINMGFYSFLAEQLTKSGRYLETIEMLKDKEGCEHKYYFQKTLFLYKGISLINLNDNEGYKWIGFAYKIDPNDKDIASIYKKYKTEIDKFYLEYYKKENIDNLVEKTFYSTSKKLQYLIKGDISLDSLDKDELKYHDYEDLLEYVFPIVWDFNHLLMKRALQISVKLELDLQMKFLFEQFYNFDIKGIGEIILLFQSANLSAESVFSKMIIPEKLGDIKLIKKQMEKYINKNHAPELISELKGTSYQNNVFFYSLYGYFATKYNQDLYNEVMKAYLSKKPLAYFNGALLQFISEDEFVNERLVQHLGEWTYKHGKTEKIKEETFNQIVEYWNTGIKSKKYYKAINTFNSKLPKNNYSNFALNFISGGNVNSPFYQKLLQLGLDFDCFEIISNEIESKDHELDLIEFQKKYLISDFHIMKYIIESLNRWSNNIKDEEKTYYLEKTQDNLAKILKQVNPEVANKAIKDLSIINNKHNYLLDLLDLTNKELRFTIIEILTKHELSEESITKLLNNKKKLIREAILLILTNRKPTKEIKKILIEHLNLEKADTNKKIIENYLERN